MVHGKNRIPYWIDRRLPGLAGPEYHAIISFGLPIEPEYSQYGESRCIVAAIAPPQGATAATSDVGSFDGCGAEVVNPWQN